MKTKQLLIFCFIALQKITIAQFTFVHITDLHVADGLSAGGYDLNAEMFKIMKATINNTAYPFRSSRKTIPLLHGNYSRLSERFSRIPFKI